MGRLMRAETICPICKKKVVTECEGCITSGTLTHQHKGKNEPDVIENVKWKITEKNKHEQDCYAVNR